MTCCSPPMAFSSAGRGQSANSTIRPLRLLDEIGNLLLHAGRRRLPFLLRHPRLAGGAARATRVEGRDRVPAASTWPLWPGWPSGRPHTFIVKARRRALPGSGLQESAAWTGTRSRASCPRGALAASPRTSRAWRPAAEHGHPELSRRSLTDDRDMPPARSARRLPHRKRRPRCGAGDLLAWLPDPKSPFRRDPALALDGASGGSAARRAAVQDPEGRRHLPHLGRGMEARRGRESDPHRLRRLRPQAGADSTPPCPAAPCFRGPPETLGRCPLEYCLRPGRQTAGGVHPRPHEVARTHGEGQPLHAVFHAFFLRLHEEGRPHASRDRRPGGHTADEINDAAQPPNREVRQGVGGTARAAASSCRRKLALPACPLFEVAVGMEKDGRATRWIPRNRSR